MLNTNRADNRARGTNEVRDAKRAGRDTLGQTNAAVMRYPGRHFPGVLIQGDSLHSLCRRADDLCQTIGRGSSAFEEANALRNILQEYLSHYKVVLGEHDIPLPFSERLWVQGSARLSPLYLSGLGQSRRLASPLATSGLPPTADIMHRDHHFRKVPKADVRGCR
jgi:hypothetical protein